MWLRARAKLAVVAVATLGAWFLGCADDRSKPAPPAARGAKVQPPRRAGTTHEAAGDIARRDSVAAAAIGVWITDANVLSLLGSINGRLATAANIELQSWQSDTVRAFAASMAHEHAEMAHAVDSLSARLKLNPVAPALAQTVVAPLQAQIDTLKWLRGTPLDRAYVRQQVANHEALARLVPQLSAVAERPEVEALATSMVERVKSQLSRAKAMSVELAAADSAKKADTTANGEERPKKRRAASSGEKRDSTRGALRDTTRGVHRDTTGGVSPETPREAPRDTMRVMPRDTARVTPRDSARIPKPDTPSTPRPIPAPPRDSVSVPPSRPPNVPPSDPPGGAPSTPPGAAA